MAKKTKPRRAKQLEKVARRETRATRQGDREPLSSRSNLLWALGLSFLGWLHRAAFLYSNVDRAWPFSAFYEGDAETFFRYARALLAGEIYDSGLPFHPPAFAYLLAGIHALLGAGAEGAAVPHLVVKLVLAAISSLSIGLVYLLVLPYLGRTTALLTALLAAYHFGLYVLAVSPVTEGFFISLMLATLLLFTRAFEHPLSAPGEGGRDRWPAALLLGLLGGLMALTRAESALLVALMGGIGIWAAWRRSEGGQARLVAIRPWLVMAVAFAATLLPWTLHNADQLAQLNARLGSRLAEPLPTFVPLTLYGPINLALANNPQADGTFSRDFLSSRAESGTLELTDPEHLRFLLHGDRIAFEYMREQPLAYARLVLDKWRLYFASTRLGWSQWNWPGGLRGRRQPVDVFTPTSARARWLMSPLLALGLFLCLRHPGEGRRWALLVLLVTVAGLLTTALFFGYARQSLLLMPLWLSLAAGALCSLGAWFTAGRRGELRLERADPAPRLLKGLAAAALLLLVIEGVGATADRTYRASGTTLPGSQKLNRDLPVDMEPMERAP